MFHVYQASILIQFKCTNIEINNFNIVLKNNIFYLKIRIIKMFTAFLPTFPRQKDFKLLYVPWDN